MGKPGGESHVVVVAFGSADRGRWAHLALGRGRNLARATSRWRLLVIAIHQRILVAHYTERQIMPYVWVYPATIGNALVAPIPLAASNAVTSGRRFWERRARVAVGMSRRVDAEFQRGAGGLRRVG